MIKRNKRILIVIGILSFLLLALLFGVNYFYYENTFKETQIDYTNKGTEQTERSISLALNNDYELINRYLNDDLDISSAVLQGGVKVFDTITFENSYLNHLEDSYLVNNTTLQNNKISFYKLNDLFSDKEEDEFCNQSFLVFYYEEYKLMVLIDSSQYLNNFMDFNKIVNYVVMSRGGYFYVNNKSNVTNLTSFVKMPDDIYIRDDLVRPNKLGGILTEIKGEEVFVSVKGLDNGQQLLLVYEKITVFEETKSVLYIFIVTTISAYVILVLSFILGLVAIAKRYNDIEVNRFNIFYNKPPIIYINSKGKIKGFNQTFKREYSVYKNISKLNNIFINPIDELMLLIRKQNVISGSIPRSEEHTSELQSRPHLVCR